MDFSNSQIGCCDVLGFKRQRSSSSATSQTGDYPVDLSGYKSVYVNFENVQRVIQNRRSTLAANSGTIVIPINQSFQGVVNISARDLEQHIRFENLNTLIVTLRDTNGNLLTYSGEWEILLKSDDGK